MTGTPDSPTGDPGKGAFIERTELLAVVTLFAGAVVAIGFILVFVGATGADVPGVASPSETPAEATSATATGTDTGTQTPLSADGLAITELARRSIELLPQGRWQELYDDFVREFQDRCSLADFIAGGEQSVEDLGDRAPLLAFKEMQTIEITGDEARAVFIGEVRGQSEYSVEAFFRRQPGGWQFVPAPGTAGCDVFNRP